MNVLIGGSGRLGQALVRHGGDVVCLPRATYADWHRADSGAAIGAALAPYRDRGATVLVAAGLLDPRLAPEQHRQVNLDLPANLIDAAAGLGVRVVTFGTVMEALLAQQNPYVRSKAMLGSLVAARAAAGADVCHVRVHTLYGGGQPSSFMFLGLMLDALRAGRAFKMTSGKQLREYHHVDDEAAAIGALQDAGVRGVVELSNGAPLTLLSLARAVFDGCGAPALLEAGALPEPADENYETVLARHSALAAVHFRPALPAVVDYMAQCLQAGERA